jgi:hypothetical protein
LRLISGKLENLAAGTGSDYGIPEAIKSWTDEVSKYTKLYHLCIHFDHRTEDYDPANPVASHFTQVVWKNSKQVGCAVALCDGIFDPKFGVRNVLK